jgi:hypothetical protein
MSKLQQKDYKGRLGVVTKTVSKHKRYGDNAKTKRDKE